MTATNYDVTSKYASYAPDASQMARGQRGHVFTSDDGNYREGARSIYSYGRHFEMARIMPDAAGNPRGWWLVNGDSYSNTTSKHQSHLRAELQRTGLPVLIVPFSTLEAASIRYDSIVPVEVRPDEFTTVWHSEAQPEGTYAYDFRDMPDGSRQWATREHHLGASVFTAEYRDGWDDQLNPVTRRAAFVSAFDEQEGHGLYFLAQLPDGSVPATVGNALVMLRPAEVLDADAAGVAVTRQGDVFAVPAPEVTTASLPGPSRRGAYVLGVNHTATEVRVNGMGQEYARGTLRHRPRQSWRRPEHRMQKMGDGRTWHKIVKNTVPAGRSWSVDGRVD